MVKTVFFPLQFNMYKSMSKMRLLQPEMKAIQERFAADPQRMRQEQAKLFQREKVNPLAGCLPLIPTMFVFYALFHVLNVTIEMRHTPFVGWIRDMSAADPTTIFNLFGLIPWDPRSVPLIGGLLGIGVWPLLYGVTMVRPAGPLGAADRPDAARDHALDPAALHRPVRRLRLGPRDLLCLVEPDLDHPAVHHHAPHRRRDRVRQVDHQALRQEEAGLA